MNEYTVTVNDLSADLLPHESVEFTVTVVTPGLKAPEYEPSAFFVSVTEVPSACVADTIAIATAPSQLSLAVGVIVTFSGHESVAVICAVTFGAVITGAVSSMRVAYVTSDGFPQLS